MLSMVTIGLTLNKLQSTLLYSKNSISNFTSFYLNTPVYHLVHCTCDCGEVRCRDVALSAGPGDRCLSPELKGIRAVK